MVTEHPGERFSGVYTVGTPLLVNPAIGLKRLRLRLGLLGLRLRIGIAFWMGSGATGAI